MRESRDFEPTVTRGRRGGTGARAWESKQTVGAAGGRRLVGRSTGSIRPENAGKLSDVVFYQEPLNTGYTQTLHALGTPHGFEEAYPCKPPPQDNTVYEIQI